MSFEGTGQPGHTLVICDVCGHAEEFADGRVHVVSDVATEQGWSILSNDHAICPDCEYTDDEGELIARDREIDARVSPIGEFIDFDVLP